MTWWVRLSMQLGRISTVVCALSALSLAAFAPISRRGSLNLSRGRLPPFRFPTHFLDRPSTLPVIALKSKLTIVAGLYCSLGALVIPSHMDVYTWTQMQRMPICPPEIQNLGPKQMMAYSSKQVEQRWGEHIVAVTFYSWSISLASGLAFQWDCNFIWVLNYVSILCFH